MDYETRLETNPSGVWEICWTETDADGSHARSVSTRTEDKQLAEEIERRVVLAGKAGGYSLTPSFTEFMVELVRSDPQVIRKWLKPQKNKGKNDGN